MIRREDTQLKPLIVWDVDDVLNNLTYEWFDEFETLNRTGITYEKLSENPPDRLLGISRESYLESLDDFRMRRITSLKPVEETMQWFIRHGNKFRHAALTATPFRCAPASAQWVIKHYGNWIRTFHFVPSPRKDDQIVRYHENKLELLSEIAEVSLFIDDSKTNLILAESAGINSLAFPRPWNRNRGLNLFEYLEKITLNNFAKNLAEHRAQP